jgi:hypothetical protein
MLGILTNMAMLAAEWQRAAWLRVMRISVATGAPAVQGEPELVRSEKAESAAQAPARLETRSTPNRALRSSRKTARANTRRLSPGNSPVKRPARANAMTPKRRITKPHISKSRNLKMQVSKSQALRAQIFKPRTSKRRGKR